MPVWLNVALFQAGWWACVLSAGAGMPWIGVLVAACVVGANVYCLGARAGLLVGAAIGLGFVSDTVLLRCGAVRFGGNGSFAPLWMAALWANFAVALPVSMRWLQRRYAAAAVLGAIAGPASYLAGERLGAIEVNNSALVAVQWLVALPLLVRMSEESA